MSGQPTRAGWAERVPGEWRGFAAFLRNPVLPDRARISLLGSARALPPLFVLDMLLMAVVLGGIGLATALGLKLPEHMLNGLELTPTLIALIVVGMPIVEEIAFRGWLSGRLGHFIGTILSLPAMLALLVWAGPHPPGANGPSSAILLGVAAAFFALAGLVIFLLRKRDAAHWFQRHFRWFYFASALVFAAMHLTNFAGTGGPSASQLPLVLPQLMLGLVLGYIRVNYGLFTGAALHMLHNAAFAGLMLLGAS